MTRMKIRKKTYKSVITCLILILTIITFSVSGVSAKSSRKNIKFVVNGGKFVSKEYKNKKTIVKKTNLQHGNYLPNYVSFPKVKRKDYHLLGWYTKKKGGKYCDEGTYFRKDMTLYARWEKPYKVQQKYKNVFRYTRFDSIEQLEKITGELQLVQCNAVENWPNPLYENGRKYYNLYGKNWSRKYFSRDKYYVDVNGGGVVYQSKNGDKYYLIPYTEKNKRYYFLDQVEVKAKNIINIKSITRLKKFCMKLGSREYEQCKIGNSSRLYIEVNFGWIPYYKIEKVYNYGINIGGVLILDKNKKISRDTIIMLSEGGWRGENYAY